MPKLKKLRILVIRNDRLQNLCIQRPGLVQYFYIFARHFLGKEYKIEMDNSRNGMGLGGMNSRGQGSE